MKCWEFFNTKKHNYAAESKELVHEFNLLCLIPCMLRGGEKHSRSIENSNSDGSHVAFMIHGGKSETNNAWKLLCNTHGFGTWWHMMTYFIPWEKLVATSKRLKSKKKTRLFCRLMFFIIVPFFNKSKQYILWIYTGSVRPSLNKWKCSTWGTLGMGDVYYPLLSTLPVANSWV